MCYDINAKKRALLKLAEVRSIQLELDLILPKTNLPLYHSSGFSHPKLPIFTADGIKVAAWGLLPFWAKDKKIMNNTLNARSETMFKKNAFRQSAKSKRCVISIDGFYEHHHFQGKTYPFYIYRSDLEPMALGGLYTNCTLNGETLTTFSIVTCKGNELLSKLHNNPKLSFGARMPVILPDAKTIGLWLSDDLSTEDVHALTIPFPANALIYHTVNRLRGKAYIGNVPDIEKPFEYPELIYDFDDE